MSLYIEYAGYADYGKDAVDSGGFMQLNNQLVCQGKCQIANFTKFLSIDKRRKSIFSTYGIEEQSEDAWPKFIRDNLCI